MSVLVGTPDGRRSLTLTSSIRCAESDDGSPLRNWIFVDVDVGKAGPDRPSPATSQVTNSGANAFLVTFATQPNGHVSREPFMLTVTCRRCARLVRPLDPSVDVPSGVPGEFREKTGLAVLDLRRCADIET